MALRRDTPTLTSSSKKMRPSASIARFGMNLRVRLARHLHCIMIPPYECQSIDAQQGRPQGRREGTSIEDYVVEEQGDRVLKTFKTQAEAITWAKSERRSPK